MLNNGRMTSTSTGYEGIYIREGEREGERDGGGERERGRGEREGGGERGRDKNKRTTVVVSYHSFLNAFIRK